MSSTTPIYDALRQYAGQTRLRLHMPGHVGRGLALECQDTARLDVTEVPGLDDLHLPRDIIEQSRHLLARAFGAEESFFLVNGATSGIHALFLALTQEGDKVLIPRNAHRSFFGGMVLSGAVPVYIPVQTMDEPGIALSVTVNDIEPLIEQSQLVFLVSPSYYGTSCDLERIARMVHDRGKLLLVDEAHGAHFRFSRYLPPTALECGADAAVNGLHKTMPVLNQGACLHIGPGLAGYPGIKRAYSLLTTTSPSYPLLASMELARAFMEEKGETMLAQALQWAARLRYKLRREGGLPCYYEEMQQIPGVSGLDGLKVLIGMGDTGLTGYDLAQQLRDRYKIQVEIADHKYILAMFSIFHQEKDWDFFYQAVTKIAQSYTGRTDPKTTALILPPYPIVVLSPRRALQAPARKLPLRECRGHIAGEMVAAYPPGIPCLLPGEMITAAVQDYLGYLQKTGARVQGPQDSSLRQLTILDI